MTNYAKGVLIVLVVVVLLVCLYPPVTHMRTLFQMRALHEPLKATP